MIWGNCYRKRNGKMNNNLTIIPSLDYHDVNGMGYGFGIHFGTRCSKPNVIQKVFLRIAFNLLRKGYRMNTHIMELVNQEWK